ncbi:MAG: hypothetical protein ACO20I_12540 [bacterium]|jgi:hypothetical protein
MAQRISSLPVESIAPSELTFVQASTNRGLGAMTQPNAGMRQGMLNSSYGNPALNPQLEQQVQKAQGNAIQNAISAVPQATAEAAGRIRKDMADVATTQSMEQQHLNNYMANLTECCGLPNGAISKMGSLDDLGMSKVLSDVQVSAAMNQTGAAPELAQMNMEANRYRTA